MLAGIIAAVAVLPTAVPITMRLATAEQTLALRHAQTAAAVATRILESDGSLSPGTRNQLQIDHLSVTSPEGLLVYQEGPELPGEMTRHACVEGEVSSQIARGPGGQSWALTCADSEGYLVLAGWRPPRGAATEMALLVLALAAIVGIVTALGVLRLLNPLSRVSKALDRVGAGERGVRLSATGMSELDELVDRLNAAARSVEDREREFLERIQMIQEMARMVAHEVRNPLQSLELLTSLIASETDEEERNDLAGSIHQEIRALDMVVNRVLRQGVASGTGLTLQKTRQSVVPLIDQVMKMRSPEAKAQGITLERGEVPQVAVSMDPALLGRSVENLVLNAMQAVPPNRGRVKVWAEADDDALHIVVEDNGPGVPEAFGDHIYEPNVSGRTGGTGLGLALVKGVIEAHGGYIAHDRSPLGGARFTATIPRREDEGGE